MAASKPSGEIVNAFMDQSNQRAARRKIEAADPYVLIATLASCDSDGTLLDDALPYAMRGIMDRSAADLPAELRQRLTELALTYVAGEHGPALPRSHPKWRRIIDFAAGTPVPDEYVDMLMEEACLWPRRLYQPEQQTAVKKRSPEVAIVGAGLSGIALGVYLQKAGIPFTIYEKNPRPGGTWFDNRYPGCGVDTASHIYSFSFALNPGWKRHFSKQGDVLDYVESCIARFGLDQHIRYGAAVSDATYDEASGRWRFVVEADGRSLRQEASVLVSAVGQLNVPSIPHLKGLDTFAGEVMHTAQWRPDVNVAARRVALIGSGASAVQLGPSIAPSLARLIAFQRSPQWLSSRPLYHQPVAEDDLWIFENVRYYLNWYRMTLFWQFGDRLYQTLMLEDGPEGPRLSAQNQSVRELFTRYIQGKLADRPDLLQKVLPDYPPMAKRIPIDFGWYDMLKRDNVELVVDAIDRIEPDAVVTADGRRYEVDLIVLATGFEATRMLQAIPVRGRGGIELQQVWSGDDPRAYLGIMVPGFPNFFIMYGPNTNLGHGGSLIFQIECQARYVTSAICHLASTVAGEIEVAQDACDAYNEELDRLLDRTVWNLPDVNNWFKNSRGRIVTNSPWRLVDYWQKTRKFDPSVCVAAER